MFSRRFFWIFLILLTASSASASGTILWQTGFPMRMGEQVALVWIPFVGAAGYEVTRIDETAKTVKRFKTTSFQLQDPKAATTHTYVYMIKAIMPDGSQGPISAPAKLASVNPPAPPQPDGIARERKRVLLAWNSVEDTAFYNIYRVDYRGATASVGSSQLPRYTDRTAKDDTGYIYYITAVGLNTLESARSKPMAVKPFKQIKPTHRATKHRRVKFTIANIYSRKETRLKSPTDIDVNGQTLYITDSDNRRITVLDFNGKPLEHISSSSVKHKGSWGMPWGLDVSDDGSKIAVTYLKSSKVRVMGLDPLELVLDITVAPPKNIEEDIGPTAPMDVTLDPDGGLWVSESTYAQVIRYDAGGRELFRVGNPVNPSDDVKPGPFKSPTFLIYNMAKKEVQVVDGLAARVYSINADGEITGSWWRFTAEDGPINLPKGVQYTPAGELLMVDGIFSTLQTVSEEGELIELFAPKDAEHRIESIVSAVRRPDGNTIFALSKIRNSLYELELELEQ